MLEENPDLDSFRQQWRQELAGNSLTPAQVIVRAPPNPVRKPPGPHLAAERRIEDEYDELETVSQEEHAAGPEGETRPASVGKEMETFASCSTGKEPVSALDHYEKAVEKETQGSLGDSLNLYRKAYRLDAQVDKKYKNKHFPAPASSLKPTNLNPPNAPVTVPNPAHHSLEGPESDLAEEFRGLSIIGAPPLVEGTPAPPCPISTLPGEVLVELLTTIALTDVAVFVRLAQVCKFFYRLIVSEEGLWKQLCLDKKFGFSGMHYRFACDIQGIPEHGLEPIPSPQITPTISWKHTFQTRPRIRFTGVYISTVNYTRPGASSPSQITWNTPVHIVTYYRYLRFFRDGSVVSLLTTTEPSEVVPNLTRENIPAVNRQVDSITEGPLTASRAANPHPTIKSVLRGRWCMSEPTTKNTEAEVHIETEGVDVKYMYSMRFALRSVRTAAGGGGPKNTKLQWKGFWSYNRLTDDWAQFSLRNDRAFIFSTVRSYGMAQ